MRHLTVGQLPLVQSVCLFCQDYEVLMQLSVTLCLFLQMHRDSMDVMFNWHLHCLPFVLSQ